MGSRRQRQDRGAGGFGSAYQVFFNGNQGNELVALMQNNINITNPSYPDPFGGRDPISFVSDGAAEHRHHGERSEERADHD